MSQKITQKQFGDDLFASYNIDDPNWGTNAKASIDAFFAALPPSKSTKDPKRLGSKSVMISTLKTDILDQRVPPYIKDDQPSFNALKTLDQYKFQIESRKTNTNEWVHDLEIVPENLQQLGMSQTDFRQLIAQRTAIDNAKLIAPPSIIDGDAMINRVLPGLTDNTNVLKVVVPALLLATGRRTIEILKTAEFSLGPGMRLDGFEAIFKGQAKVGLSPNDEYTIPLLAPFWLVKEALDRVRANINTTAMTPTMVHNRFEVPINMATTRLVGLKPHELRSIYAMMCFHLNPGVSSMMGYISTILGHVNPNNAKYYQRIRITNFNGPYKVPMPASYAPPAAPAQSAAPNATWVAIGAAEKKCVANINALILQRVRITQNAVRGLGTTPKIYQRVMSNPINQAIVDNRNSLL